MAHIILGNYDKKSEEIVFSLFQEVGNILTNSYLNAIVQLTNLNMLSSVPAVTIDMLASILIYSFMDAEQYDDIILALDTNFSIDEHEVVGNFFYIPKPGSIGKILNKLGV